MRNRLTSLLSTPALLIAAPALAQTPAPVSPPPPATLASNTAEPSGGLQDIVVTATRRSANLQQVPITIEAVPASTLHAFNVTGILSLPSLVSGLVVVPSGGNNLFLRGIGTPSTGFNEAQVAVYLDGLYLANPTAGIFSFNNIDRVEVLKGPQGTLYGRNATGGLISVITRDPGNTTRLDASIGYANYNTLTANLFAAAPVTPDLSASVAVYHQKQADGWSKNVYNGDELQKSNETGVQAKLAWRPGSNTKVTLSFLYDYNNKDVGYAYETFPGTLANDGTPFLGKYKSSFRIDPSAPTNIYISSLKVEQDLGFAKLQSLFGYQNSNANVAFPGGNSAVGQPLPGEAGGYTNFFERNRTFSEELQLVSKQSASPFDWIVGAFYYDDHTELRLDTLPTCVGAVCAPGPLPQRNDGFPQTLSGSVFADGSYRFAEGTHVSVGLRYTAERKTLSGLLSPLAGYPDTRPLPATSAFTAGGPYTLNLNGVPTVFSGIPTRLVFHRLTYRFVLAQDIGENFHLYVSHNLGFKSGAYNGNLFSNPPVKPELLYATEVGFKSEFLNRRVRLNASYFHYTYNNVQVRSSAPPAPPGNALLLNAAREKVDGVDVDLSIVPARGLTLNGALEYLDAKYADFPGTVCPVPAPSVVDSRGVAIGKVANVACNLAGATPQFAARWSATIGASYTLPTSSGAFTFAANDHYTSSYPTSAQYIINPSHHIIDASLGWTAPNKRIDAQLWVKNLTRQYVYAIGQAAASFVIVPAAPRTFGATIGVHL